jgi:peptide/nickel transport system substrate-binding protein
MLTPMPWVEFILFNCSKPWFRDKRVRQALYMAVDKEKIINDIYYGTVERTLSYLNPSHWAYNKNLKDPGYNPRKAAEMLDAAGWKIGTDGIRQKDGLKMAFSVSTTAGAKSREQSEMQVQKNFKDIGVALEIKNFTPSVMWGKYFTEVQYDMVFVGWDPPLGLDPDYTQRIHSKSNVLKHPKGGGYTGFDGNPEMDRLLEEGVTVSDQAKRKQIYDKFQGLFLDECVFAPIFAKSMVFAKKKGIRGYQVNPYSTDICWNIQDWSWG